MTKKMDRPDDTCCEGCFGMAWIPELDRRFILCNNPRSDHYGHIVDARHSCGEFGLQAPEWRAKYSIGDTVKIGRLDDPIANPDLIGLVGKIEEVDPLPNGEYNYYVDGHYMHEGELENVEKE